MFLRIGRKIINTENLVDADVFEVGESMSQVPYRDANAVASLRTVVITTTAVEAAEDGVLEPRRIVFEGEDADLFLEALPRRCLSTSRYWSPKNQRYSLLKSSHGL